MDPENPDTEGWSEADIASMLNGRDDRLERSSYVDNVVEPSPGFHPGEGEYVIDPDYMEMLGITDPDELIQRKGSTSR